MPAAQMGENGEDKRREEADSREPGGDATPPGGGAEAAAEPAGGGAAAAAEVARLRERLQFAEDCIEGDAVAARALCCCAPLARRVHLCCCAPALTSS